MKIYYWYYVKRSKREKQPLNPTHCFQGTLTVHVSVALEPIELVQIDMRNKDSSIIFVFLIHFNPIVRQVVSKSYILLQLRNVQVIRTRNVVAVQNILANVFPVEFQQVLILTKTLVHKKGSVEKHYNENHGQRKR